MGSIFFLMAVGLSLCFGLMRVISLDQLLYYSIGAYVTYSVSLRDRQTCGSACSPAWWSAGIAGFAVERLVFLRIYERDITFTHDHVVRRS